MRALVLLFFAALLGTLRAQPSVRVAALADHPPASAVWRVVGGKDARFAVTMEDIRGEVRAQLYQQAGGIAAPVRKDLPVARDPIFTVSVPAVRHVTAMELRFEVQADERWLPAGSAKLVVYPDDLRAEARALLASAREKRGIAAVILGASPRLHEVLGLAEAAGDSGELRFAEAEGEAARALLAAAAPGSRLVLFTRDPELPPGVYWTTHASGFVAKVTLPVLADLEQFPDRELLLLTLIQQALHTIPSPPP